MTEISATDLELKDTRVAEKPKKQAFPFLMIEGIWERQLKILIEFSIRLWISTL